MLTIALIAGIYLFFGKVEISNTINDIVENSPADNAGIIQIKIVSINGIKVKILKKFTDNFESPNKLLELKY